MDAVPVVSNGPNSMIGVLWKCAKALAGLMVGQRWGSDEKLTVSQIRDRFKHDPASLNSGLRRTAEYLQATNGDVQSAFHLCSQSKRTGDLHDEITQSVACSYLYQLLPEEGGKAV
jgi:hypothetical protein